ncbi:aspartate/glutamate racemase family protein [Metallumcola ferriviriculae]|uniref:Aspartate/glutamate racemase family protein n=1 Tax=Metallumcola ferriviriculae TaxID=3039180 RepID=A0AAU0UQT5_9FIRM|nr:aspartate/glutamate racemase family protein [Desulfitibacteraceae bacterium MK1]
MIYEARPGQVSYGEAIGVLLLDTFAPFIPGDVGNASTYSFPVRYKVVKGFTAERIFNHDLTVLDSLMEAGRELVNEGVKAVTGDCGYMALYQQQLANELEVPVFLSSLLQVPFISRMLKRDEKVGIIVANSGSFNSTLLNAVGVTEDIPISIKGLEDKKNFHQAAIIETGTLDAEKIEQEVVSASRELTAQDPKVKAILLECSMLPPYGAAVQKAVNLPVFDYVTMINYVYTALIKRPFTGFM